MPIKVLLVEDRDTTKQGLRSQLEQDPDIELVGEAVNADAALRICGHSRVDVAVVNVVLPPTDELECVRLIKKKFPATKVLVRTLPGFQNHIFDIFASGADGYLLSESSKMELHFAIDKIAGGGMYVGPEFTLALLDKHVDEPTSQSYRGPSISEGELKVLDLIAEGLTNTQMANKLFISVRTIESRRKKLLEKTGTTNTATLIKFAIQHGLIR